MGVTYDLRPVAAADDDFLYALSVTARADGPLLETLPASDREHLLRSQFELQRRHYALHFPTSRHEIVLVGGRVVGRVWVDWRPEEARCLDIALLPDVRGAGLGGRIIEDLKAEGARRGVPLTLHVERNNPAARRLYERLGFRVEAATDTHTLMRWDPQGAAPPVP